MTGQFGPHAVVLIPAAIATLELTKVKHAHCRCLYGEGCCMLIVQQLDGTQTPVKLPDYQNVNVPEY